MNLDEEGREVTCEKCVASGELSRGRLPRIMLMRGSGSAEIIEENPPAGGEIYAAIGSAAPIQVQDDCGDWQESERPIWRHRAVS